MTPFAKVYDVFMYSLRTNDIIAQYYEDPMAIESKLLDMLKASADIRFKECAKDLKDRDDEKFNVSLTDEEIRILALGMKLEYISNDIIPNEMAVRNAFYTKDYQHFSPNQKVKNIMELEETTRKQLRTAIRRYQYYNLIEGA